MGRRITGPNTTTEVEAGGKVHKIRHTWCEILDEETGELIRSPYGIRMPYGLSDHAKRVFLEKLPKAFEQAQPKTLHHDKKT